MIDALIFLCFLFLFIDYMDKSFVSKNKDDLNTKKWLAEIEADKRREKFYGKKDGDK
jgi:hypothetical protein